MFQKQVYRHNFHAVVGESWVDTKLGTACAAGNAEHLWNGRAGDIRIQNSGGKSTALHHNCQGSGDHRFANAAFTADNTDYLFNMAEVVFRFEQALRFGTGALAVTGSTVAGAAG